MFSLLAMMVSEFAGLTPYRSLKCCVIQKMRKDFTPEDAAKVFTDIGSKLEITTDFTNSVGRKYGARGFPTMVVVGKDGKIANVNVGAKPDIETVLKGQLDALMK